MKIYVGKMSILSSYSLEWKQVACYPLVFDIVMVLKNAESRCPSHSPELHWRH